METRTLIYLVFYPLWVLSCLFSLVYICTQDRFWLLLRDIDWCFLIFVALALVSKLETALDVLDEVREKAERMGEKLKALEVAETKLAFQRGLRRALKSITRQR